MKRYFVFWFAQFYPCGGWNDLMGSFDTLKDVQDFIEKTKDDGVQRGNIMPETGDWQVVDSTTGSEVNAYDMKPAYWDVT